MADPRTPQTDASPAGTAVEPTAGGAAEQDAPAASHLTTDEEAQDPDSLVDPGNS